MNVFDDFTHVVVILGVRSGQELRIRGVRSLSCELKVLLTLIEHWLSLITSRSVQAENQQDFVGQAQCSPASRFRGMTRDDFQEYQQSW